MKLKTKYKDFKIEFNTNDGNFIAYDKNNNIIKKTKAEEEMIQYLDNYENNKNRLNIPIIRGINPFDFSIKTGKIVSIINKSNDKVEEVYVNLTYSPCLKAGDSGIGGSCGQCPSNAAYSESRCPYS